MKTIACICAAAAFALLGASAAVASDHGWDHKGKQDKHDNWKDGKQDGWKDGKHKKGWNKDWDRGHGWNRPRGWRSHSWRHGDRFRRYPGDNYVVISDWWFYGLSPPPRGYRWVRTWDGFILVRIHDGIIFNFVIR